MCCKGVMGVIGELWGDIVVMGVIGELLVL